MSESCLSNLATISIEQQLAKSLDYVEVINIKEYNFTKVGKVSFHKIKLLLLFHFLYFYVYNVLFSLLYFISASILINILLKIVIN